MTQTITLNITEAGNGAKATANRKTEPQEISDNHFEFTTGHDNITLARDAQSVTSWIKDKQAEGYSVQVNRGKLSDKASQYFDDVAGTHEPARQRRYTR